MRRTTCWTVVIPAVAVGLLAPAGGVEAQSYPVKPVRIIVANAPGGGIDFVARHVGLKLGDRLGRQFIVENRTGAGGTIGTTYAAKAAPDGYTLLLGQVGPLAMSPHVEKVAYDPLKDFVGVSLLASSYHVLAVHPSLPVRSVKQLIALAKSRPGQLTYGVGTLWGPTHLVPELFNWAAGVKIDSIFYRGAGPAAVGLVTGEVQVIFASVTALMPHMRSQRVAALAVTSPKRSPVAPELPTLGELGVRGVEAPSWVSLVAPAATPKDVLARLHGEIVQLAARPDYRAPLEKQALEPTTSTQEEFAAFLHGEHEKWGKIVRAIKIK